MYGTAISDRAIRSCSLHPDSMKVSNEPPGNHLHSPVAKPSNQFIAYGNTTGVAPTFEIPSLPAMVSLKKIYADLLGYLFDHGTIALTTLILLLNLSKARAFFKNTTVDGASIWGRLGHEVTICLATPNGWEASQQVRLYRPPMTVIWSDNDT